MNLARVEYYMSDILSVLETREFDETGKVKTQPLVSKDYCRSSNGRNDYGELTLPGNLFIVGTVNMDETTFPFSKKVLDRANTIEFSYVDLAALPSFTTVEPEPVEISDDLLAVKYIKLNDCNPADTSFISKVCATLQRVNNILEISNAHIGYRVRDEIVFYMLNNQKAGLLTESQAFDNQIMQKILPRIQGSSETIKTMLGDLLKLCESEGYEASVKKINFMLKRCEEDGFTSYWI
jgi:5-methylcytosine-specific restriction endonuclease McrBC GTP-binding regulatory subunit McrB